jgi:hypothetical protein
VSVVSLEFLAITYPLLLKAPMELLGSAAVPGSKMLGSKL